MDTGYLTIEVLNTAALAVVLLIIQQIRIATRELSASERFWPKPWLERTPMYQMALLVWFCGFAWLMLESEFWYSRKRLFAAFLSSDVAPFNLDVLAPAPGLWLVGLGFVLYLLALQGHTDLTFDLPTIQRIGWPMWAACTWRSGEKFRKATRWRGATGTRA